MSFSHTLLTHHGRPCPYCGVTMRVYATARQGPGRRRGMQSRLSDFPTRDHAIPKSLMPGMGTVIVCNRCNSDKGARTLDEWLLVLCAADDLRAATLRAFMLANARLRFERSAKDQTCPRS